MLFPPSPTPTTIPGSDVRVVFSPGALLQLPDLVRSLHCLRVLLVTDPGLEAAGHAERALRAFYQSALVCRVFDDVCENPTTTTVRKGVGVARNAKPDVIIGLGGGSSMDTAKGINFLLTNGGEMHDYHGTGKATKPMLPMIAVPTTAGTGSEAQSYALISDAETHVKMACGDKKALPKIAVLDPELTATCPPAVAAATAIDAVAHAVETAGCNKRTDVSRRFSKQAWDLLNEGFETALANGRSDLDARQRMLLGAHYAGCAIENSMLGAAHACANPLTAHYGTTHGPAVGLMLPHVVRFNCAVDGNPYADLMPDGEALAQRLTTLLGHAKLPTRLRDLNVPEEDLPKLAADAARQWTANFNPRPVTPDDLLSIYRAAY